jgi:zinc transporter ZupT
MGFWWLFILFFFPFTGGTVAMLVQSQKTQQLKLFLSFSGAFLFSVTAVHLLPEVYSHGGHSIGFFVLAGFFLQVVSDQFSKGIEHGHLHFHPMQHRFPIKAFIALSLHALLEGLALGGGLLEKNLQQNLLFGIALHEIPAAFALATLLKMADLRKNRIYGWMAIYAMMVPLGVLLSDGFTGALDEHWRYGILALVIGVFLHISTTILFENSEDHQFSRYKLIAIALGISTALMAGLAH